MAINEYISGFDKCFLSEANSYPWIVTQRLVDNLYAKVTCLNTDYKIIDGIAIHKTAIVERGAVLKAPVIVDSNSFIGSNAYLREGVYLGSNSSIGPGCEVKTSIILNFTEIAHLNFIGDSIIGSNVNFEAGSIIANYFNERPNKEISARYEKNIIKTGVNKFGALVGDNCKIGANAVLSPGTILSPSTIVMRLQLIDQITD